MDVSVMTAMSSRGTDVGTTERRSCKLDGRLWMKSCLKRSSLVAKAAFKDVSSSFAFRRYSKGGVFPRVLALKYLATKSC